VPLSITFDDGCCIQYEKYYPVLDHFDLPATFYVVTNWVGKPGFMDLEDLSDLWKSHNEIGSHTHTHPRLSSLTSEEVAFELDISKNFLSRFNCTTLAYPFGDYSDRVVTIAINYYLGARTYSYSEKGNRRSDCNFDLQRKRYELEAFPTEHSINPEYPSLISLTLQRFKSSIQNIVNKGIEKKAWTILVFHGSTQFGLKYLARGILKHPLNVIRNARNIVTSLKHSQIEDEINKFHWLCEFLAANDKIQVMTVAKALDYFDCFSTPSTIRKNSILT
jgi:peptidoglycan/xylan/chitin deacetylase (PgdA/CDA1 family)